LFLSLSLTAGAQTLSYDPYAPAYDETPKADWLKDPLSSLIAFPFEIVKWPVNKTLFFVESEKIHKKVKWIYEEIKKNGLSPHASYSSGNGISAGLKVDFPKLTRLRSAFPDLLFDGWVYYGDDIYFQAGTELGLERIGGTGFYATSFFQYENRFEEDFYGIGPDTSLGDGSTFKKEETELALKAGYEVSPELDFRLRGSFRHTNIYEGEDRGKGQLERYGLDNIPGLRGNKVLSLEAGLVRDTRDFRDVPTKGSYQKLLFSYNEGIDGSDAAYFRYQVDAAKYWSLGTPRRVLAVRFYGEHLDEAGGNAPFYDMAKLGGYGTRPRLSQTLRGYDHNRFYDETAVLFNIEYRYTIWENRDFRLDTVLFFDEGQVFDEFSNFQFKDFKESYGVEFRLSIAEKNVLNISIAHGDEGTNFFVKSSKAF